jgi:miniconductance mechanosensitive channel
VVVQNWDKTLSVVPAYDLVSDSFRNWRGMSESGGRRIKRSLTLDYSSVRFCDEEMLERFRKFEYIRDYVKEKLEEVKAYNEEKKVDTTYLINGRHLTNLGTFRAYVKAYLENHPQISRDLTFLVRQLDPTPQGIPIQVYVFSRDQVWANYEAIQADIFDHLIAVVPLFDLRIYQQPSGADVRAMFEGLDRGGTEPEASGEE